MTEALAIFESDRDQDAREAGLLEAMFSPCEADPELRCYLLLDASASSDIVVCLEGFNANARCLFDGMARDDLGDVAPWLVEVKRYDAVTNWYASEGHGSQWGIIIHSRLEPPRLKARLKRFLKVTDEFGDRYFFKFYVPRNFNALVPEFHAEQRESLFNGIVDILTEDHANKDLLHRHQAELGPRDGFIDLAALGRTLLAEPSNLDDDLAHLANREDQT